MKETTVADEITLTQFIVHAASKGEELTREDFVFDNETGEYTIDGMDPFDWLDAMTMD
jgi:hypothetical protein